MKEWIYALRLVDGEPFYVGRTNNIPRRMKEHARDAKTGTETKYQFIREILAANAQWDHFVLAEINDVTDPYEDYWVYLLLCDGYTLTNMKMGDAAQQARNNAMSTLRQRGERYSSAKEFLGAVEREKKEAAARAQTARLNGMNKPIKAVEDCNPLTMLFDFEKVQDKFVSPAYKALLAKRAARLQKRF
jgi:hypothetical protein